MRELKVITATDLDRGILVLSPKRFTPLCKLKGQQVWIKDNFGQELFTISNDTDEKNLRFTGVKSWYQSRNIKVYSQIIITYNDGELLEKSPVIYVDYGIADEQYLKTMNRPNLFSFATSELSQDAFLAWFLSWANPEYEKNDSLLHKCSQDFLTNLIGVDGKIEKVVIKKQWKNVDLFVKVECQSPDDNYGIVIEDKVKAKEHNNQLERYKILCEKRCKEEKLIPKFIFIKTKDSVAIELNRESIETKGYKIIDRGEILLHMKDYSISNLIFMDFKSNLQQIDIKEAKENEQNNIFLEKLGGGELINKDGKTRFYKLNNDSGDIVTFKSSEYYQDDHYWTGITETTKKKYKENKLTHWCLFDNDIKRLFKIPVEMIFEILEEANEHGHIMIGSAPNWKLYASKKGKSLDVKAIIPGVRELIDAGIL